MADHCSVRIAPELANVVMLGVVCIEGAANVGADDGLDEALLAAEARARKAVAAERTAVRRMYSRAGIDPTKTRPSSEALLRRVQRGGRLPRINPLVDVCNWCSLEFQLPYGLYDLDRVEGPVELRLGREGEAYAGIGKDEVHVAGRLTLADREGAFGNPTSDSARTMVTAATTRALVVLFAPRETGRDTVTAALDATVARLARFTNARETQRLIV